MRREHGLWSMVCVLCTMYYVLCNMYWAKQAFRSKDPIVLRNISKTRRQHLPKPNTDTHAITNREYIDIQHGIGTLPLFLLHSQRFGIGIDRGTYEI
jgi:hypothetical protein